MLQGNLCRKVIHMNKCTMIMRNTFVLIAFVLAGLSTHKLLGETEKYIVVTSPAYVNYGVFSEEAKKAIRPMWEALRKRIDNKEDTNVEQLAEPGK